MNKGLIGGAIATITMFGAVSLFAVNIDTINVFWGGEEGKTIKTESTMQPSEEKHTPNPTDVPSITSSPKANVVESVKTSEKSVTITPQSMLKKFNTDVDIRNKAILLENYSGSLQERNERDSFEFTIANNGFVWIEFEHENLTKESDAWNIMLSNETEEIEYKFSSKMNSVSSKSPAFGLKAGTYNIQVEDSYNYSEAPYSVKVYYLQTGDGEIEFNGDIKSATSIVFNEAGECVRYGSLANTNDSDFYRIDLSQDGCLSFGLKHNNLTEDSNSWNLKLMDYQSKALMSLSSKATDINTYSPNIGLSAGTYYIQIDDAYNHFHDVYALEIKYEEGDKWEREFNDTVQESNIIKPQRTYYGSLMKNRDVDYYQVDLTAGNHSLSFNHDNYTDDSNGWRISILDKDSKAVLKEDLFSTLSQTSNTWSFTLAESGIYYIKVTESYEYNNGTYLLEIR